VLFWSPLKDTLPVVGNLKKTKTQLQINLKIIMRNYYLLLITLLLSNVSFSQDEVFLITNESKKNQTAHVYEIVKTIIKTDKYEKKEIPNPEYVSLNNKIDSLNNQINILSGSEYSEKQRQSLSYALSYLKKAIDYSTKNGGEMDIFGDKWIDIRKAKKELVKTGMEFQQTTKRKYSLAINEAKINIEKIQNILGLTSEKQTKIAKLEKQISDLDSKINSPFKTVKKQIIADVVTGEVEREALIISSENSFNNITGKFIAVKNDQYNNNYRIMKENHKGLLKNELVLGETIEDIIEDKLGSFENLDRLTENVSTYIYRDENDNSYLQHTNEKYLIKSLDNDKLYLTTDNILDKVGIANTNNNKNDNIKIPESDIKLYSKYYQQALNMLDIVSKHRQSYNSRTMTKSRLANWKSDLKKLISIHKKMDDIHYGQYKNQKSSDLAYQYYMSFSKKLSREQKQAGSIISDMIRECKILTGI
jgi:hypothetical protein